MYRLAVAIAGGLIAVLGISDLAQSDVLKNWSVLRSFTQFSSGETQTIDRSRKGNRLVAPHPGEALATVTVVEVGTHSAAVVYRDRDGRELFRTDPLSNVTIVAKDVALPEVTIPERPEISPAPTPGSAPQGSGEEIGLEGCDPVASPLAGSSFANRSGRCLAANENIQQVASLAR